MVLSGEDQQFGFHAARLERCVVPLSLPERAAEVISRMDDKGRRRDEVGDRLRALRTNRFGVGAHVLLAEEVADVARSGEHLGIEEPALDDRRGEPVVVGDRPRGEVTAIGPAEDAETLPVEARLRGDDALEEVEHVGVVERAHALADGTTVLLAVARRAARVAVDDRVARSRENLGLVEEVRVVRRERPAVDHQQHGMRPLPLGQGDPAVHLVAVARGDRVLDGLERRNRVEVGELSDRAVLDHADLPVREPA